MMIPNNTVQSYYRNTSYASKTNTRGTIPAEFQSYFDNYYNSLREASVGNASNPMPNAPQSVKDAWEKTKAGEIGEDGMETVADGRLSHISGYVLTKMEQRFQTGSGDMFGSTADSAIAGAQKILDRLNNPWSPPSSTQVAVFQEKEKVFYQKFIENLTASQRATTEKETNPVEIYEQMTGRSISGGEPSYSLNGEQITDLKSRYDIENITSKDYQSLMKELSEMGVVAKNEANMIETTEGGLEMIRRPIILGLYPQGIFEQNFIYDTFENGNYLEWAQNLTSKYDNAISWIMGSGKGYNDAKTNEENVKRLQNFNDSINRTLQVLNQLK